MIVLLIAACFIGVIAIVESIYARRNTEKMMDAAEQKRLSDLRAGGWP
ncbi:MAG TPA: hypothetical protein VFI41_12600 [Gemmatimonadales bacterium]|nr:hypothetical protein [Gemmatimonadales bacterium]